jgi:hypothetical protein
MMNRIIRIIVCTGAAVAASGCWPGPYGSNGAQYVHRSDTITLSAGNAKEVNAATQVIDPWPRYVGDRRIPANGERMVGAVQRYQRSGVARTQGQIGQPAAPGGAGAPPAPPPPAGAAVPPATLPY